MRSVYLIVLLLILSGCTVKPEYAAQTITGLEVGVSKDTNKVFKLIDRNNRVIARTTATKKKLFFSLPAYTSPNICYTVVDEKGKPLFDGNLGFQITSIYDYTQDIKQKDLAEQQYATCVRNEEIYSNRFSKARADLNNNKLFNGSTCDLPRQRPIPPFPETICGNYQQCHNLAKDSCMKNLVDAESCGAALLKTNVHSSITSVSCGALVASLNGEQYGIASGVQDAITGALDQHTKDMIEAGEYEKAFGTGVIRVLFTYLRTENCIENFTKAAYAPIEQWIGTKEYIEREPYLAQNECNALIDKHNSSLEELNNNRLCIEDSKKRVLSLSRLIEKAKDAYSAPKACTF